MRWIDLTEILLSGELYIMKVQIKVRRTITMSENMDAINETRTTFSTDIFSSGSNVV